MRRSPSGFGGRAAARLGKRPRRTGKRTGLPWRSRWQGLASRAPRPWRTRRRSPLGPVLTVAGVLLGAWLVVAFSSQYARTYTLAREASRLAYHRQELTDENARLRDEIQRLQFDDRYIEELARRQLGLVRPGEVELLIVPPGLEARPASPAGVRSAPIPAPHAQQDGFRAKLRDALRRWFGWLHRN